jgi:hypothetical protein
VPAVGDHRQLHQRRAPVVEQGVDRGPDGAPGVEDVVHEDHRALLDVEVEDRVADHRERAPADADVVAVEGDVHAAERRRGARVLADQAGQALGERHPSGVDADERELLGVAVPLHDLVGDAGDRAAELVSRDQLSLVHRAQRRRRVRGGADEAVIWLSFPASLDRD